MKKRLFLTIALFFAPALILAAQTPVTQIEKFNSAATKIDDVRVATNVRLAAAQSNFTELYTLLGGNPWLAQATAPSIHNVFWIDTAGSPPIIKYWDGDSWEVAAAGGDGTYTLPTASTETKGGVKIGARLTMTGEVLSADVQNTDISGKQDTLVSGTNIKTINGTSVLGLGNIVIDGGSISLATEQNWTAVQNFDAGLTATGITITLGALSDIKFGTDPWVDDTKTSGHLNYLWSSKRVFDQLALKSDTTHNHAGVYEPADSSIIKVSEIDTLAEFEALLGWSPGSGGSFTFDTFPTYEDSAHTSGIAVNGTTLAVYSSTASKWLTVGLTDSLNPAPVTYAATLTITDAGATGDTFTLNSIAYDAADSPVSVTNLPTATEAITYTGSNTATCTGDVTGTGPWTINASPATAGCTITAAASTLFSWNAESLAVQIPTATATLVGDALIVPAGGHDGGNSIETNTAATGYAAVDIGDGNFNEQAGNIDFWVKSNAPSGSTTTRYVIRAVGQTGVFYIGVNHSTLRLTIGTDVLNMATATNYFTGNWRHCSATWDLAADTYSMSCDDAAYTASGTVTQSLSGEATSLWFAGYTSAGEYQAVDDVTIQ